MAISKLDPEIVAHLEWIAFVRPTGLVVSAPALVRAGAILDRRDAEGQRLLRACVAERMFDPKEGAVPYLSDFRRVAELVLGWNFSPKGYVGTTECPIPTELEVPLPDYGETLRPDFAVRELEPKDGASISRAISFSPYCFNRESASAWLRPSSRDSSSLRTVSVSARAFSSN